MPALPKINAKVMDNAGHVDLDSAVFLGGAGPSGPQVGQQDEAAFPLGQCTQVVPLFELPNFETPDGRSPIIHIQALREAMQEQWSSFRRRWDEAAAEQFAGQEALFIKCLEDVSGCRWPEVQQEQILKQESRAEEGAASVTVGTNIPAPDMGDMIQKLQSVVNSIEQRTNGPSYTSCGSDDEPFSPVPKSSRRGARRPSMRSNDSEVSGGVSRQVSKGINLEELQMMQMMPQTSMTPRPSPPASAIHSAESTPQKVYVESKASLKRMVSKASLESDVTGDSGSSPRHGHSPLKSSYKDIAKNSRAMSMQQSGFLKRNMYLRFSGCMDWWEDLQEPERTSRLALFVTGKPFEMVCAMVIIFNAALSCSAINREVELLDPEPSAFMAVMENIFIIFYTTELALKICVHKCHYFCNQDMRWNIFDAVLVAFSLFDIMITHIVLAAESDGGGGNFTFMRTLRILKMARVLRGLRVMRFFLELRLMLNSLIGSLSSLFWSIAMLGLIFYIFGLVFVQGVSNYLMFDEGADPKNLEKYALMMKYFGRVERACLSLYQACTGGDDWYIFFEAIGVMDTMYQLLFIFFIAFSQIALLNILTAIFVNNAMMYAMPDKEAQAMEALSTELQEYKELTDFLNRMDVNADGYISAVEFARNCKTGKLGLQLTGLGLNIKDTQNFFQAVAESIEGAHDHADGSHDEVPIKDFVDGCMQLRGSASCIDLRLLSREIMEVQKHSQEDLMELKDMLCMLSDQQERVLGKTEQALARAAQQQEQALAKASNGGKPGDISRC
mmetsp:Transcript_40599/g.120363  ORF Transcript_40599/g.120363 Transcript_40599/m.120363 type:complete len:785 (-) Transcript_40599:176-2530(-)